MCGIAGVIGPKPADPERIGKTKRLMRQRGPDGRSHRVEKIGDHYITLLHGRLSIIDLNERSDQPFVQDGFTLIYNGEIYNYVEVREELERLGQTFRTTSDTEVLLQAWRHWGPDSFDRMEGMWAFVIVDQGRGEVVLSRDRFGEKPLYYWEKDGFLYFGSEVKFLASLAGVKPDVDQDQICRYLVNGYKSLYKQPSTFFRNVREIPPASWITLRGPGPIEPTLYWSLTYNPQPMTLAEALEGTREKLLEAVRIRLRADVPIAFCLSGGIDSSTLAGIAAKCFGQQLHTFSIIDNDERYHELDNIQATVDFLGCESVKVHTSTDGFFERLAPLVAYHDAPVATVTYYLHSFLSQAISEHGYRVAISGTAADELFTGYYDHYAFWLAEMRNRGDSGQLLTDWRASYGAYVQNPILKDPLVFGKNPAERGHIYLNGDLFRSYLRTSFTEEFFEAHFTSNVLRNRMLNELFHEATPVILHEDDLNSMFYSIENRSPYLDRGLAEFIYSVPSEHLIKDGYVKWLLRAAGDGFVTDQVRLDKRKRGFNASIDSLINRGDSITRERLLSDSTIFDYVRRDALKEFLDGSMKDNSFSKFLFSFVSARLFLEHCEAWHP